MLTIEQIRTSFDPGNTSVKKVEKSSARQTFVFLSWSCVSNTAEEEEEEEEKEEKGHCQIKADLNSFYILLLL